MNTIKNVVILYIIIICFIPFVNSDPSFIVITPKNNQLFTIGDNLISWDPPVDVSHMRIELFKGFNYIKAIDIWVDNTGEYIWTINKTDTYERRSDYKIKISSSIISDIYGWSEKFRIDLYPKTPEPPESIDIAIIDVMIISVLLVVLVSVYYRKSIHNYIIKIKSKLKKK